MKALQLFCCCLLVLVACTAQAATDSFLAGNQAYQQGQYDKALELYRQAAAEKGYSSSLLYNMGNCFAHLKQTGPAVLAYERALLLEPGDRDARANLSRVRAMAHLPDPAARWWQRGINLLGPDQWLLGGTILLAGLSLFLLANTLRWHRLSLPGLVSLILLLLLLAGGMGLAAYQGYRHWQESVVLKEADLLISPFATAESRGQLSAGQLVRVIKKYQEYVLVRDHGRNKGWLRATDLARIDALASDFNEFYSSGNELR